MLTATSSMAVDHISGHGGPAKWTHKLIIPMITAEIKYLKSKARAKVKQGLRSIQGAIFLKVAGQRKGWYKWKGIRKVRQVLVRWENPACLWTKSKSLRDVHWMTSPVINSKQRTVVVWRQERKPVEIPRSPLSCLVLPLLWFQDSITWRYTSGSSVDNLCSKPVWNIKVCVPAHVCVTRKEPSKNERSTGIPLVKLHTSQVSSGSAFLMSSWGSFIHSTNIVAR